MRPSILAAFLAFVLLALPADAQLIPTVPAGPAPAVERVLLDMTLSIVPESPTTLCPVLEPGRLTVTVRAVGPNQPRPVALELYSVRNVDPGAAMASTVKLAESATTAPIQGGSYCLSLTNTVPTSPDASINDLSGLAQDVAIKVALTAK